MARALAERHEVSVLSYSLQYPKFLYPGGSRKDDSNDVFRAEGVRYFLNTVNPLSYVKTSAFIRTERPDLLIVQWWHPFFAPAYWTIARLVKNVCRIFFVCHNVFPHKKFPLQNFLVPAVLKRGDAFIVHSEQDERDLRSLVANPRCARTVHPTYSAFKVSGLSKDEARERLGLGKDEHVLLFFGFIREYKGLKTLLAAMPEITRSLPACRLLIVGDFFPRRSRDEYADLLEKSGCRDKILLIGGYVPNGEVEKYFAACDLVVLPYDSATQSGIVQIACGFEKPVVVTDVGGLPEAVADGKTGYVVPPKDPRSLASAVVKFFAEEKGPEFAGHIREESYKYSWSKMADVVEDLYSQVR
jgi:glycosyltransferase involved in cell wall biosynthesis